MASVTKSPRVFVVNQPRPSKAYPNAVDISGALQYGAPYFVFTVDNCPQPSLTPKEAVERAWKVLDSISEDDYILYAGGDHYGLAIVTSIVSELLSGRFKVLRWEKGYYVPIIIDAKLGVTDV